ncbi:DUF4236 domain-containing protein [Sediminicola arcticus]|uniref:DUF4236 domain-containing protein n=1 Tax=Sediminicola arcticus TaxID=1574308 RepID=A0ABV2SPR2_9FLAO
MRYRNRIKLAPGLHINLSGSGVSTTLGVKGASVNLGKSGAHLNTGIPGTGLYNRSKISSASNGSSNKISKNQTQVGVKLDLNDNYEPVIEIYDDRGIDITTQASIAKIKRSPEYKANLLKIYELYYNDIIEETTQFTDIYKHIVPPISKKEIQEEIDNLKLHKYRKKPFDKSKPSVDSVKNILSNEAVRKFNSVLFWKNKKNRLEYIESNLDKRLNDLIAQWEEQKEDFEKSEIIREKESNEDSLKTYQTKKDILIKNLNGTENFVLQNFEAILNEIDIKPEFFVDFEYNEDDKTFLIDLDLPEIEHLPKETATILKSGKLSVKNKSEKQLREDYAQCATGLGFLIGGIAFLCSAGIEKVKVSAYTQRIDKKDGQTKNDYIYSIEFDIDNFSKINFKQIDSVIAFKSFEHKMELSNSSVFKTINMD